MLAAPMSVLASTLPVLSALQQQLQNADLLPWLLPELLLAIGSLQLLVMTIWRWGGAGSLRAWAMVYLAASSISSIMLVPSNNLLLANGMVEISPFAAGIRTLTALSCFLSLLLVRPREELGSRLAEKLYLMMSMALGLNLMCLSSNLLVLYLGLELASISAWALTPFLGSKSSFEAGFKYFIFGSVASACFLYGASWLYGITGSLQLTSPGFATMVWQAPVWLVTVAFVLVTAGILFKISALPFHFWAVDVYATAPLPVVALFSTAPKIASLGLLWHLIQVFAPIDACFFWLCAVAAATLTLGNLAALGQQNFRKLMAWSSIGQGGFLISALLSGSELGRDAALMYSLFYTLANVAVFELIRLGGQDVEHLPRLAGRGLADRPALIWGILSIVALLSLVGLPPTGGFTAKFVVFSALLEQYSRGGSLGVLALLVLGLLNTVLALFYYLRIPYQLFLKPAHAQESGTTIAKIDTGIVTVKGLKPSLLVLILCIVLVAGFLRADWLLTMLRLQLHQ